MREGSYCFSRYFLTFLKYNLKRAHKIKKPSLISLTFLTPAIRDLSKDGIDVYLKLFHFIFIGISTHNRKSLYESLSFWNFIVLPAINVKRISDILILKKTFGKISNQLLFI